MKYYKRKKIFLDTKRKKYCWVRLYATKRLMQSDYKRDVIASGEKCKNPKYLFGVHRGYTIWIFQKGQKRKSTSFLCSNETGTVYLSVQYAGAGIVSHELLHAVLWAWRHRPRKNPHPIIIKNMREEEELLRNHTYAVRQFYIWYWKVERQLTKLAKML